MDSDDDEEEDDEYEYKSLVKPEELQGINSIWNFVLTAANNTVVNKAAEFLINFYINPSEEIADRQEEFTKSFLASCFKHLTTSLETTENTPSKEVIRERVLRCLLLIRNAIGSTETQGIGMLKSHSGLVNGETLLLKIFNQNTVGKDIPKKAELKLSSNTTVFRFRQEIGKIFKCQWQSVSLTQRSTKLTITPLENGRSLGDMRFNNGEGFDCGKL